MAPELSHADLKDLLTKLAAFQEQAPEDSSAVDYVRGSVQREIERKMDVVQEPSAPPKFPGGNSGRPVPQTLQDLHNLLYFALEREEDDFEEVLRVLGRFTQLQHGLLLCHLQPDLRAIAELSTYQNTDGRALHIYYLPEEGRSYVELWRGEKRVWPLAT